MSEITDGFLETVYDAYLKSDKQFPIFLKSEYPTENMMEVRKGLMKLYGMNFMQKVQFNQELSNSKPEDVLTRKKRKLKRWNIFVSKLEAEIAELES